MGAGRSFFMSIWRILASDQPCNWRPLARHPELAAHVFQQHRLESVPSETFVDDPAIAGVEKGKQPVDLVVKVFASA